LLDRAPCRLLQQLLLLLLLVMADQLVRWHAQLPSFKHSR
jgi:hypothetical protein